jgi:hypothetical protein
VKAQFGNIGGLTFNSVAIPANTYGLFAKGLVALELGESNILKLGKDVGGAGKHGLYVGASDYWYGNGTGKAGFGILEWDSDIAGSGASAFVKAAGWVLNASQLASVGSSGGSDGVFTTTGVKINSGGWISAPNFALGTSVNKIGAHTFDANELKLTVTGDVVQRIGNFTPSDPAPIVSTGTFLTDASFETSTAPTAGTIVTYTTGIWYKVDAYDGVYGTPAAFSFSGTADAGTVSLQLTRGNDGADYGVNMRLFQNCSVSAYQGKTIGVLGSFYAISGAGDTPQLTVEVYFYDSGNTVISQATARVLNVFADTYGSEYVTVQDSASIGTVNKWHRVNMPFLIPDNATTMRVFTNTFRTDGTTNIKSVLFDNFIIQTYKPQVLIGNDGINIYESPLNKVVIRTGETSIRQKGFEFLEFNASNQILVRLPNGKTGTLAVSNIN